MTLTAKQTAALKKAPADKRQAMRAGFEKQSSTSSRPSRERQAKRAGPERQTRRAARPPRHSHAGHIFSPLDKRPIPALAVQGGAVPVGVKSRKQVDTGTLSVVNICNTGRSATIGWTINNAATPSYGVFDGNYLQNGPTTGGPTSGRPMKVGLSIANYTKRVDLEGRVFILKTDRRLEAAATPSTMTQAQVNTLADEIKNHNDTVGWNNYQFSEPAHFYCSVRDTVAYEHFKEWRGNLSADQVAEYTCANGGTAEESGMESLWVVFDNTANTNYYELVARAQYYVRFPLDNVASTQSKEIPTATQATHNDAVRAAIIGGGLGLGAGTLLSGAGRAAQQVGRAVGAAPLALGAAEEALPLLAIL